MGSFNSTCAVSRAPISPNDEVRLFYIISNNFTEPLYPGHNPQNEPMHRGLGCYAYDNFSTVGLPLKATYEDYGIFEISDPEHPYARYTLKCIQDSYSTLKLPEDSEEADEIRSRDREFYNIEADDLNFELVNDMIRGGMLFCEAGTYGKKFIGFYPVLEEVYQVLIQGTVETYDDTEPTTVYADYNLKQYTEMQNRKSKVAKDKYKKNVEKYRDLYSDRIGTIKKDGTVLSAEEAEENILDLASFSHETYNDRNEFSHKNSFSRGLYSTWFSQSEERDMTDEEYEEFSTMHTEALFYVICLSRYNYEFIPPQTSGQEYDTLDQGALLVKMGQALLRKSVETRDDGPMEFSEVHLIVSLNELSQSFEEYYDEDDKSAGLAAIREYDKIYGYKDVILTHEEAKEKGLEMLFHFLETQHLPVKFVS